MNTPNAFDWMAGNMGADMPNAEEAAQLNEQQLEQARQYQLSVANMVNDTLGKDGGFEVMNYLREATIEMPLMRLSGTIGQDDREVGLSPEQWAFVRAGQNSVVHHLEALIMLANNPQTEPAQEPQHEESEDNETA